MSENWELLQVGAPPEIACLLEEIQRESHVYKRDVVHSSCFGADPELDEFMVSFSFLILFFRFFFFFLVEELYTYFWEVFRKPTVIYW